MLPLSSTASVSGILNQYTEATYCNACHGTNYNYSTSFSAGNSIVAPGSTSVPYSFFLTRVSGSEACEGGFNVHSSAGAGSLNPGASQTVLTSGGEQLTHSTPQVSDSNPANGCDAGSGNFAWSFTWDAPVTVGTHTLQGCGNPVDGDGVGLGDAGDGSSNANRCSSKTITVNTSPNAVGDARTVAEDSGTTSFSLSSGSRQTILVNDTSGSSSNESGDTRRIYRVCSSSTTLCSTNSYSNANGTVAIVNSGLNSAYVTFTPALNFNGVFSFDYQIRDSFNSSGFQDTAQVDITVTAVNDAPIAVNDGSPGFGNGHVSINEGDNATNIGNVDLNDTDVDVQPLTAYRTGPGVPAYCDDTSPTQALSFSLNPNGSFNYEHDGTNTLVGTQTSFSYCAYDGTAYSSSAAIAYIDIAPSNDPPTISTSAGSTAFTEQIPVIVDTDVAVGDVENNDLDTALVTISGNYVPGEDSLSCTVSTGVTCNWGTAPTLTITGTRTLAQYEAILEGVQFNSTSDNPALGSKTVDFSIRDVNTAFSTIASKTVTITRANDPPTLNPIGPQSTFEHSPPVDPSTFTVTAVPVDPDVDDDINDGSLATGGSGTLTYTLDAASLALGITISNDNANPGQIIWNPPITGYPATVYGPVTVFVEDGDEDMSMPPNSVSFNITVSPPDDDADLVENYNDLCLTVPSVNPGENFDNDGDGIAGANGAGTPGTPQHDNSGGDVCDLDDDNDGMPDAFEITNGLDPFDDTDAAQDADGDGITNLQEYIDGTNVNFANLVIDATGYLTPFALPQPDPATVHPMATSASANDYGPYRPGRNTITWTGANISNPNLGTSDQTLDVRPLVNFGPAQQAEEGSMVTVEVALNGNAPSWTSTVPTAATINYSVSGTASNPADHDAVAGSVDFNAGEYTKTIGFMVAADAVTDPGETVVFTIDSAGNAVVGSNNTHTVTIIEGNIAPRGVLEFDQGGPLLPTAYNGDNGGVVNITANAADLNAGQTATLTYDWTGTDNSLTPPVPGNTPTWTTAVVIPGNYLIDVVITDTGVPPMSTRITRILNVQSGTIPGLTAADTDGDGTADNIEGATDIDADGVPNYLDAQESSGESNLIPDQVADIPNSFLLETDPGLNIESGATAQAANTVGPPSVTFSALLTDDEITQFGSLIGGPPISPDDSYRHFGGIYDFKVSGLIPGNSARVVIPLLSAIPRNAEYRKFDPATGWGSFVIDGNNSVASAPGEPGACPEPGSSLYRNGLNYLDNCLQLTIQDGGSNDSDREVNGVISDPGTVGVRLTDPEVDEVESGSSRMSPTLLLAMLLLSVCAAWRRTGRDCPG